jgi:predicted Ser/Thr protein kinase
MVDKHYSKMIENFEKNAPYWSLCKELATGKDGKVFEANGKCDERAVVKIFKVRKSVKNVKKEMELQKECAAKGLAPKIYDTPLFNQNNCYIVMERYNSTLLDYSNKRVIGIALMRKIVKLYKELGKLGITHNDSNIGRNIMIHNRNPYLIDFGFAKKFKNDKKLLELVGPNPNYSLFPRLLFFTKNAKAKEYLRGVIDKYEEKHGVIIDHAYHSQKRIQERLKQYTEKLYGPMTEKNLHNNIENGL